MPVKKEKLLLFAALELRQEYDRRIAVLQKVLGGEQPSRRASMFGSDTSENTEPAAEFDPDLHEKGLAKLQTKRLKLNQAIQRANFEYQFSPLGEAISLAEALELRKQWSGKLEGLEERIKLSAHRTILHKEGRDVVCEPRFSFKKSYQEYLDFVSRLRTLVTAIHQANHQVEVDFRDE